jgi:hypothetical protein
VVNESTKEHKLLAVKLLQGMAFDAETSPLICFTPAVCEALVLLCLQHDMSELKEVAVQLLISWSNFSQVRLTFLENTNLIDSLIRYGSNGSFCKEWILKAFVNIMSSSLHKTVAESNLVDWLLDCAEKGETNKIRNLALAGLYNLSINEFSQTLLVKQNLLNVLVGVVINGSSTDNVLLAIRVLESLTSNREDVQIVLFQKHALIERLVRYTADNKHASRPLRKACLALFYRLSNAQENEVPMFQKPFLVDALVNLVEIGEDPEVRHLAIETINNLCCSIENNIALFQRPNFVELLIECGNTASKNELKESAVVALQNLSYCVPSRIPLFQKPGLLESLVSWVKNGESAEIQAAALGTIYALTIAEDNRPAMIHNRELFFVLIDAMRKGTTLKIRERALLSLGKLGFPEELVVSFLSITALCSVRDIPRPGSTSLVRLLPKDLVRKVAGTLYLSSRNVGSQ